MAYLKLVARSLPNVCDDDVSGRLWHWAVMTVADGCVRFHLERNGEVHQIQTEMRTSL